MKKFTILCFSLLMGLASFAQDTITVEPDYDNGGALNAALTENGPGHVYLLKTNSYYTLSASVEFLRDSLNQDLGYQIVGEIPASEDDYMPVIQTGITAENLPFDNMFTVKADLCIKNIFIANQTTNGQIGKYTFLVRDSVKLDIDGCTVDPMGSKDLISGGDFTYGSRVYMTNNLFLRQGDPFTPGGGHFVRNLYADTIYCENNTIVSTDNTLFTGGSDEIKKFGFFWFNHNTVVFHDVSLITGPYLDETYVNNNLFYDLTTYVQLHGWAVLDPDNGITGTYPDLVRMDTAYVDGVPESLPSSRVSMWNRNSLYVSQALQDSVLSAAAANPEGKQLWQFPVIWNEDVPHYFITDWDAVGEDILAASRTAQMFDSPDFPNLVEDNTIYDTNPNFVDPQIEEFSKTVASSALYWYKLNGFIEGENPSEQASQFWDVDGWAGTTAALYPTAWPRWNGAYTNETLLKASTAGLPLGDLNAFPSKKAIWDLNKEKINDHILGLNTDQITDLENPTSVNKFGINPEFTMYPNPALEQLTIESEEDMRNVRIFNVTGSLVKDINVNGNRSQTLQISELSKGLYFVTIDFVNGSSYSAKLTKE